MSSFRAILGLLADASRVAFDVPVIKLRQINQSRRGCVNVKCPGMARLEKWKRFLVLFLSLSLRGRENSKVARQVADAMRAHG
jgi:hypothetical protein